MQSCLRSLVLIAAIACVTAKPKILNGPAEEYSVQRFKRGEVPKGHSKFVKRVLKDGEELDINPGGALQTVLITSGDDLELDGLTAEAEVIRTDEGFILKGNQNKKVHVKGKKGKKDKKEKKDNGNRRADENEDVIIVAKGSSDVVLETGFEEMNWLVGSTMELKSCAVSETGEVSLSMGAVTVVAEDASGEKNKTPLHVLLEGACVTTTFVPEAVATYTFEVEVQGKTLADDEEFERTGFAVANVAEPLGEVEHVALLNDLDDANYAGIRVSGKGTSSAGVRRCIAGAKLLGFNRGGNAKEIAFARHVMDVTVAEDGSWTADLKMHGKWISKNGFTKTDDYELRDFQVLLADGYVEIAAADKTDVEVRGELSLPSASEDEDTEEMRKGSKPAPRNRRSGNHKKILVHGYCASGNPWPVGQFTNSAVFADPDRRRGGSTGLNNWSHDVFAQKISTFANDNGIDGCGIIAHSQGGAAALHLYTYYYSCLDYATTSGRMIQSVGTPYQGTALAGNLAAIGDVFGAGCGANPDLTESGAVSWLTGIPSWARSKVHYYTTSFKDRWWAYDYCSLATDLFLSDPDDGVVEKARGQLSGGNNMGHKDDWCHSTGMRDTAQYFDSGRNSVMNNNAQY